MNNLATDTQFKNIFHGSKGLIIGRGDSQNYQSVKEFDLFPGIKLGCNHAYRVTQLNALIWLDPPFFGENWQEISQLDCFKFAVNPDVYNTVGVEINELRVSGVEGCSESFDKGFYPCELSGYLALNVALIMGLNPIWLHGFTSDMKDQYQNVRADKFRFISDWAKIHNKQIYLAHKEGYLRKFFEFKAIPQSKKSTTRTAILTNDFDVV